MRIPRIKAFPRPETAEMGEYAGDPERVDAALKQLLARRTEVALELGHIEAQIGSVMCFICGRTDDTQDVEDYDGSLGVSRAFVDTYEPPVGQLQWTNDLPAQFSGANDRPGNVNDVRWGTGALIEGEGEDLFLTAGHCFDPNFGGWRTPVRNGTPISPAEIAKLMVVNFNYQKIGGQSGRRPGQPFPVVALLEWRKSSVDYALVKLGRDTAGRRPSEVFGALKPAARDLTTIGAMICVIQHPNQGPKKIEAGPLLDNSGGWMAYDEVDTGNYASGSPILSETGELVGIHLEGGCTPYSGQGDGGYNSGHAIGIIRSASKLIK